MPIAGMSPKEVVHTEMHKFKHGDLHSGSHQGPLVKNRKQAIAIALSESRRAKRDAGGALSNLMVGLENSGMSPQMMPWAEAALAPEAAMGLFNDFPSGQQSQSIAPESWVGHSQGPAPDPGQAPVVPSAGVAPSFMPASPGPAPSSAPGGSGSVSWAQPSFSGGNWSNVPGKAIGGGMAPAMQMGRKPMAGLGNAMMPRPSMHPALGRAVPHAMGRDLGGMIKPPNMNWEVRNEARSMLHSGPISSIVPGRTDRHNTQVASGSYVLPADAVSHIGQSNTKSGHAILSSMFGHSGPYGSGMPAMKHGNTMPKAAKAAQIPAAHIPKFQSAGGGKDDHGGEAVSVVVAGGEYTIPPNVVAAIGGGDVKRGHRVLDAWVMSLRKKHIQELKGLPPPVKS